MEKRLPLAIVVNLAPIGDQLDDGTELTYTHNISAHGACVISNRPWKSGEVARVTSMKEELALRGKVVYCREHGDDRYAVGLDFQGRHVTWTPDRAYAAI